MLQVEQLERRVLAAQQVAATYLAGGGKGVKMPDPDEARAQFDRALNEEPAMVDPDVLALRRRLRVA